MSSVGSGPCPATASASSSVAALRGERATRAAGSRGRPLGMKPIEELAKSDASPSTRAALLTITTRARGFFFRPISEVELRAEFEHSSNENAERPLPSWPVGVVQREHRRRIEHVQQIHVGLKPRG